MAWVRRNPFWFLSALLGLLLVAFSVAFLISSGGAQNIPAQAQNIPPQVPPSEFDNRLVALDKEAIEAAYREHVQRMYAGWMKDDTGQPTRALTGVRGAQRAYISSMTAIKRREEELRQR